jgi:hypothetical protein
LFKIFVLLNLCILSDKMSFRIKIRPISILLDLILILEDKIYNKFLFETINSVEIFLGFID